MNTNHDKHNSSGILQFSIATSWSDLLLQELVSLNGRSSRSRFTEIYGAHRTNITGGGRPSYRLPQVEKEAFERHVARAGRQGLRFNYVMNAPEFGGRENDPAWLREVSAHLEYLITCGVGAVTIANASLLRFVRRQYPALRINVSLIAQVDTVEAAREFEDLGVQVINLNPFTVNRDFEMLRAIRAAVRCELELYANIPCLDHCPRRTAHYRFSGLASQAGGARDIRQDPFLMRCSHTFLSEPAEFLRSPFIRPEDISAYREIGIDVLKISDRTEATEFLVKTARAYAAEKYEGNLFELIFRSGRKIKAGLGFVDPNLNIGEIPVVIANARLSEMDFIGQIQRLRGAERERFYRDAAARVVRFGDAGSIADWTEKLQTGEKLFAETVGKI